LKEREKKRKDGDTQKSSRKEKVAPPHVSVSRRRRTGRSPGQKKRTRKKASLKKKEGRSGTREEDEAPRREVNAVPAQSSHLKTKLPQGTQKNLGTREEERRSQ